MSPLRNILQRCARNASILGGTPLQIQCTFNPVYSDPSCISRQAYSSDANEAPKNAIDPVQKYFLEMMNAKKSRSIVSEDQKASKAPTFNKSDSMKSRVIAGDEKPSKSFTAESAQNTAFESMDSKNSPPSVAKDQKTSKNPTFNKNLNLRKFYIKVCELSKETTEESLREFYSQFGEIAVCSIIFEGQPQQYGSIGFTSKEAMDRALKALPHRIDGKQVRNVPFSHALVQLTLVVNELSPRTTPESLRAFYSKFGWLNECRIVGRVGEVTFGFQKDMHLALDAQPHVIDGSEVFLQYATFDLDFLIQEVPEDVTEETLNSFYSKYGQLRRCRLFKGKSGISYAKVSYSAIDGINLAMDERPHIINGKPLKIKMLGKGKYTPVSLSVESLPENVTEEILREEFSKFGKLVFWKLRNDGQSNQSGPYGIVTYRSEQEALRALSSGPHTIEGAVVDVKKTSEVYKSVERKV
ncbi:RNA recognition motif domain-containing protein [Ditylenchus destructor]|uniref:RNA recognition motif domain-containing protein n=1 Tax=Ditylenchus destructor TaxID=166010 RepID=A0AAD4MYU4_9BILA|nr:RNA recognition motif domain-containing protein [Ditylenchus destructor]